jgi:hypothetical protein
MVVFKTILFPTDFSLNADNALAHDRHAHAVTDRQAVGIHQG